MTLQEIKEKYDNKSQFEKIQRRIRKNRDLAEDYRFLAEKRMEIVYSGMGSEGKELPNVTLMNKADNIEKCCRYWEVDEYPLQGVKDLRKTSLCHDRFCDNCQSVMAQQRFFKFGPVLDALAENFDIYHAILTKTNCKRVELYRDVDDMFKNIGYMMRYFSGDAKIERYDFEQYGFCGAIRALEITKNIEENTFHPHLHCLFLLKKGLKLDVGRTHINCYSFDKEHRKRDHRKGQSNAPDKFSDFEILLQKIWRLRLDGIRVNRKNIENLPIGYSVRFRNADGHYKEVFKYATKGVFAEKKKKVGEEEDEFETIRQRFEHEKDFETLYDVLKGRRIIQGYGALRKFDFEEAIDQSAKNDEVYWEQIATLQAIESPERVYEFLDQMVEDTKRKNVTYISRKSIGEVLAREEDEVWELKK